MVRKISTNRRLWIGSGTVLILLVAWYLLTSVTQTVGTNRFPGPEDLHLAAQQMIVEGYAGATLLPQIWASTKLVLLGFAVAAGTGVPLGILMGWSRRTEAFINPVFQLIRPIPPLAWIPLAILWFGLGDTSKVFVIWLAAFVPSLINSYTGVRTVDPMLIAAAKVQGASSTRVIAEVIIPGALPMIFTGLRVSLQASWTTLVAAELVGALTGLGHVMQVASRDIYPGMIAFAMIWFGILGALMTKVLGLVEKAMMPWLR
jgi:taurine transport system permease protein